MEKSPRQVIIDAARVDQFIKDEVIVECLGRLERKYWLEFLDSKTSEERVRSWAKANVLRDFKEQLKIVVDAGEHEVLEAAGKTRHSTPAPRT